jgi:transketolase
MVKVYGEIPTRFGYGDGLVELGKKDERIFVLSADLTSSTCSDRFQKSFPDRFIEMGIAEQDMLGTAAGLALSGKIPFVSTYSVFVTGRAFDQIRTTICYANLNVQIGGAHGGISVGPDGATHQALEDIALMRVLPNMKVIVPADYWETKKATMLAPYIDGPVFIRFGREKVPVITKENDHFDFGKGIILKEGKDVAIIANGLMVHQALFAVEILQKKGIFATLINLHTVKTLDKEMILDIAKLTNGIVTAEEHQIYGGLGSAVAEFLSQNYPIPIKIIGIKDRFGESGKPKELLEKFGLTADHIVRECLKVMEMKNGK